MKDDDVTIIPQCYPLWAAFLPSYLAGMKKLSRQEATERVNEVADLSDDDVAEGVHAGGDAYRVVGWECKPGHVPQPVVTYIGNGEGLPYYGDTRDAALDAAVAAAMSERDRIRQARPAILTRIDSEKTP